MPCCVLCQHEISMYGDRGEFDWIQMKFFRGKNSTAPLAQIGVLFSIVVGLWLKVS